MSFYLALPSDLLHWLHKLSHSPISLQPMHSILPDALTTYFVLITLPDPDATSEHTFEIWFGITLVLLNSCDSCLLRAATRCFKPATPLHPALADHWTAVTSPFCSSTLLRTELSTDRASPGPSICIHTKLLNSAHEIGTCIESHCKPMR